MNGLEYGCNNNNKNLIINEKNMSSKLTKEQCKKKLFNVGVKFGVSPALISTRLLSSEDKEDMLNGLISDDVLELFVKVWKENGMPDNVNLK